MHHIITEHQSGFQPKDSTVNQLVYIYNTIISNLDIGKDIRFIFGDISKAFDRVWHTGLLYKLRKIGIDAGGLFIFRLVNKIDSVLLGLNLIAQFCDQL
jgi:hypothetical protein